MLMDAPQSEFSLVKHFPPDLWAAVVPFLDGETLGRMMLTGSKLLWSKLKSRNTVRSVELGNGYLQFKSWPSFLTELPSIEELSIDSRSTEWWLELGLKLEHLPPTLKHLKFYGFLEIGDFFLDKDGNMIPIAKVLPHLEAIEMRDAKMRDYTWIPHCPESLTSLGIQRWDGKVELPASLLHLTVYRSMDYPKGAQLPPRLETLDVPRLTDPLMLIPSLTSFSAYNLGDIDLAISPESLVFLPANLTELTLSDVLPSSSWSFLPQNLQKLGFTLYEPQCATVTRRIVDTIKGTSCDVTTYPFELLPKSLTYLSFYVQDMSDYSYGFYLEADPDTTAKPLLPPRLTTLKSEGLHFSPNAAKHLPSSLTHLEIDNLSETIGAHLPEGLTYLSAYHTLMSPDLIRLLPNSLLTLQLHYAHQESKWFDFSTGEGRQLSECPEFPIHSNLTQVDWRMDVSFPPNLTSLKLANFKDLGDSPRNFNLFNLLSLNMSSLEQFSDADVPLLSRHLVSLSLTRCTKVSGKSFAVLPRSLTYLELRCSSFINDDDIQHLPPTLEEAFFCAATSLTNRCIIDFPRHLRKLHLSMNKIITEDCIPDLPYAIRSVDAYFSLRLAHWGMKSGKILRAE